MEAFVWTVSNQFSFADRASYVEALLRNLKGSDESLKESATDEEANLVVPLVENDRVVWLSDYGPEYGIVRWVGNLPDTPEVIAGIEFVSFYAIT